MAHKYLDDNGQIIAVVSSSVPGLTLIPPGKTLGDAIDTDEKAHDDFRKKNAKAKADVSMTPDEVMAELTRLQGIVAKLQGKPSK